MAKNDGELFSSEWAILQVVWEREPCAAPMVQESLTASKGWTYSTVKTIMDRMVVKGLLEKEKVCNLYLYRSVISEAQAKRGEVMKTLKRAFDGALTPMMQFMLEGEDISEEELGELERVIRDKKRGKKKKA